MTIDPKTVASLATHLPALFGWGSIAYCAFKIANVFIKGGRFVENVSTRAEKAESTLQLVATNHLPHIQTALDEQNETLKAMREDMRLIMVKK
jgi:hypothetical protein